MTLKEPCLIKVRFLSAEKKSNLKITELKKHCFVWSRQFQEIFSKRQVIYLWSYPKLICYFVTQKS